MSMVIDGTSGLTMPGGTTQVGSFTSGTAVASTSGTSIDFTSIPSWVKRITVMFNGVSTNGTSNHLIQLGSGSATTSGYVSSNGFINSAATNYAASTAGFLATQVNVAADAFSGSVIISLLSSNTWVAQGCMTRTNSAASQYLSGLIALGGTLDRVRITTAGGTDTFDAGSINILYE